MDRFNFEPCLITLYLKIIVLPVKFHCHSFFEYLGHPIMHHWAHKVFSHVVLQQCEDLARAGDQKGQKGCPPEEGKNMIRDSFNNYLGNTANYH